VSYFPRRPGLKELLANAKPGECPFCGDPCKPRDPSGPGRPAAGAAPGFYLTCGEPECENDAYNRYWKRDHYREMKRRAIESRLKAAAEGSATA